MRLSRILIGIVILGVPALVFFAILTSISSADTAEEPYSIYIIAGQSQAEGSNSTRSNLPNDSEGFNKRVHPADAETKFWWAGADGAGPKSFAEALEFVFQGKTFVGWTFSGYGGANPSDLNTRMSNLALGNGQKRNDSPQNPNEIFGPEYGIARTLYEQGRRKTIILKVSYGFQSLAQSSIKEIPFDWNTTDWYNRNKSYRVLVEEFNRLTQHITDQGGTYTVDGFFWHQGGTDAVEQKYADVHQTNFSNLLDDARTRFELHPDAHFVAAKIGYQFCSHKSIPPTSVNYQFCGFPWAYRIDPEPTFVELLNPDTSNPASVRVAHKRYLARLAKVKQSLQDNADARSWVDVFEVEDLKRSSDNLHFNELSQLEIGRRFANMYRMPYRPPLSETNRADYDKDGKSNKQEDTGNLACELIGTPQANGAGGDKAGNGNLGDDDCDGDGYPNYIDRQDGVIGGGL